MARKAAPTVDSTRFVPILTAASPTDPAPYDLRDFCPDCRAKIFAIMRSLMPAPPTTTPEQTLAEAGISTKRQARYQRRMSSLLAGRE